MYETDHYFSFVDESIRAVAQTSPVLDLGTFFGFRKQLRKYEGLFDDTAYVAMDYKVDPSHGRYTPDVDGDIQELPFRDGCAGGVICKDVLEHVPEPQKAVREMHRVLKPGGLLFVSIPFIHPYHGSNSEKNRDYYRFTTDAVEWMFRDFSEVEIARGGGLLFVVRGYLPPRIGNVLFSKPAMPVVNWLDRRIPTRNLTPLLLVRARK